MEFKENRRMFILNVQDKREELVSLLTRSK